MILEEIEAKLKAIDPNVFYGANFDADKVKAYNYIVFGRNRLTAATNRTGYTDEYWVTIVREGWVPDGLAEQVIEAMQTIPGMRFLQSGQGEYDYAVKPGTSMSIELLRLPFTRGRK